MSARTSVKVTRVKVTRKGQVTIPQVLREALGIEAGDYVTFYPLSGGLLLSKTAATPYTRAEDLLRDLVVKIGREAERQGIYDEKDLEPIIDDIQSRVYLESYGS